MNDSLDRNRLKGIVSSFKDLRVGVIGDVMLDIFTRGTVTRLSPEAPVPVVLVDAEEEMLGGAGNVAVGAASLGADVVLFGVRGEDRSGAHIAQIITGTDIQYHIVIDPTRRTTVKHRIISDDQHLLRVDWESTEGITQDTANMLLEALEKELPSLDALVVADYAKGIFSETFAAEVTKRAHAHGVMVTVDAKPKHFPYFKGVSLMSPNHHEALEIAGTKDIQTAGSKLVQESGSRVLITQGADGMHLFTETDILHEPSHATSVVDVSGAGDTVSIAITLALAAGATETEALAIASASAAHVVSKPGTATVHWNELIASI